MPRRPRVTQRARAQRFRPVRRKLDPRLALLLSLSDRQRRALKADEEARTANLNREVEAALTALDRAEDGEREGAVERLQRLEHQMLAPLTTGLFLPSREVLGIVRFCHRRFSCSRSM